MSPRMIFKPQPRLRTALSLPDIVGSSSTSGEKPTPWSLTMIRSFSGSGSPSTWNVTTTSCSEEWLCSKALMQASTTAIRTSSILSGLIRIDSAIAVAVRLASISISGTIGSASMTSLKTPPGMSVQALGVLKGKVELQSVDHDGMDQVVRQQPAETGQGAHREQSLDRNLRDRYVLPNGV